MSLVPGRQPPEVNDKAKAIDDGFDFVDKAAQMSSFEQVKWITKQTVLQRSLIFKWSLTLVERALKAKMSEGALPSEAPASDF